uniref:Uncharacterized protein n=1 Tax=viral metagenome TaxID=1070528 RepID=A0A6C0DYS4_9ZZZZ
MFCGGTKNNVDGNNNREILLDNNSCGDIYSRCYG